MKKTLKGLLTLVLVFALSATNVFAAGGGGGGGTGGGSGTGGGGESGGTAFTADDVTVTLGGAVFSSGATNVSINPTFTLTFKKNIDESKKDEVVIQAGTQGGYTETASTVTVSGKQLTITPDVALNNETAYILSIKKAFGLFDGSTPANKIEYSFTTEAAANPTVSIQGTLKVGQELTAVTSGFDEGVTLTYKWYRGKDEITGATKRKYTLTDSDLGKRIKVEVYEGGVKKAESDQSQNVASADSSDNPKDGEPVTLVRSSVVNNQTGVELKPNITLEFSNNVNTVPANNEKITLSDTSGNKVDITITNGISGTDTKHMKYVTPVNNLSYNTKYTLKIGKGIQANNNTRFVEEDIFISFTTIEKPVGEESKDEPEDEPVDDATQEEYDEPSINVSDITNPEENALSASMEISASASNIIDSDKSKDAAKVLKKAKSLGKDVELQLQVDAKDESKISKNEVDKINKALDGKAVAAYLDINLALFIVGEDENVDGNSAYVTNLNKPVKITVDVPSNLPALEKGKERNFYIVRMHNDETDVLGPYKASKGKISFNTDRFSTYAIAYEDVAKPDTNKKEPTVKPNKNTDRTNTALPSNVPRSPKTGEF